jgi:hypothetical protein
MCSVSDKTSRAATFGRFAIGIGGALAFSMACGGGSTSAPHVVHDGERMPLERAILFEGLGGHSYPDLYEVFLPAVREALLCEVEPGDEVGELDLRVRVDSDGEASVEAVLLDGRPAAEPSERVECVASVIDDVEGPLTAEDSSLPSFTAPDELGGEHRITFRLGRFRWYEEPACYDTHSARERCPSEADLVRAQPWRGAPPPQDEEASDEIRDRLTPKCECMTAEELEARANAA